MTHTFKVGDNVVVTCDNPGIYGALKGDIGTITNISRSKSFRVQFEVKRSYVNKNVSYTRNYWYISAPNLSAANSSNYYWDWELQKEVIYDFNLIKSKEFDGNSINTHTNLQCVHESTLYQGFTESYHFCKKCDKRLD